MRMVHLSSMSTELVATIFWITSGGGGAAGLGGGTFFFVFLLAPFSSDFLSELFSELFSDFFSDFLPDFDFLSGLASRMIGGRESVPSSSEIGIELTDSVDDEDDETCRDRTLAVAISQNQTRDNKFNKKQRQTWTIWITFKEETKNKILVSPQNRPTDQVVGASSHDCRERKIRDLVIWSSRRSVEQQKNWKPAETQTQFGTRNTSTFYIPLSLFPSLTPPLFF